MNNPILISPREAEEKKAALRNDELTSFSLDYEAKNAFARGPYSVTFHKSPAASGDPHDYFSEGRYWWPNPKDPSGPYIRRDGLSNPDNFYHHRSDIAAMSKDSLTLALAGYYLDKPAYLEKAYELLYTWFVSPETRMNPHLNYSQAIRGQCDGRSIGVIDTVSLIQAVQAAWYLEFAGLDRDFEGIKAWFRTYLVWLNTSENGRGEKNYYNNHGIWWHAQAISFAAYCGDTATLRECIDRFREIILPTQLSTEGGFSDELTRTNSYTYSLYSLIACSVICEVAYHNGVDLWSYATPEGKGMRLAIDFIAPYYENPFTWTLKQIAGAYGGVCAAIQMGAQRLGVDAWKKTNQKRRRGRYAMDYNEDIGYLYFLTGNQD